MATSLTDDIPVRRVYVVSPLAAPTNAGIKQNIARAQRLCYLAMAEKGVSAFASHAFYPLFLNDADAEERELGLQAGLDWLEAAEEIWVWSRAGITGGMKEELELAKKFAIPVVMDPECFREVDG